MLSITCYEFLNHYFILLVKYIQFESQITDVAFSHSRLPRNLNNKVGVLPCLITGSHSQFHKSYATKLHGNADTRNRHVRYKSTFFVIPAKLTYESSPAHRSGPLSLSSLFPFPSFSVPREPSSRKIRFQGFAGDRHEYTSFTA